MNLLCKVCGEEVIMVGNQHSIRQKSQCQGCSFGADLSIVKNDEPEVYVRRKSFDSNE